MNGFLCRCTVYRFAHTHIAVDQNRGCSTFVSDITWCAAVGRHIKAGVTVPNGGQRVVGIVGQVKHIIDATFNFDGRRRGAHGIHKRFGEEDFVGAFLCQIQDFKIAHLWCGDGAQIQAGSLNDQAVGTCAAIDAVQQVKHHAVCACTCQDGVGACAAIHHVIAIACVNAVGSAAARDRVCTCAGVDVLNSLECVGAQ